MAQVIILSPPPRKQGPPPQLCGPGPVHQTLASAANLANLLPTGMVLAFQTFAASFSNNGLCRVPNKYLTAALTSVCAVLCFLSSFTDTFVDEHGKLHYGIATFSGLYIFDNDDDDEDQSSENDDDTEDYRGNNNNNKSSTKRDDQLEKFRLRFVDFVHALASLAMFLVFALSDSDVQSCYFSGVGADWDSLFMNLPLGVGALCSFLFTIFPTTRRGIGLN